MTDRTKERVSRWAPSLLTALALGASLLSYFVQSKASAEVSGRVAPLEGRVSVLEARRQDDSARLDRIEAKIDRLDSKVDRVLAR